MFASDAAWNNAPLIITAVGVLLTGGTGAVVSVVVMLRQSKADAKREAAEAAAAAVLATVAHQTDGINKTIELLATEAGKKKGADELQAKIDSAAASEAKGKAEAEKQQL